MSKKQDRGTLPYSISQNFLTSRALIERLLRVTDISARDTVLEIGAGKGHITQVLSERCKKVIAYEIDGKLYERLKPQAAANVQLHHSDFLKCRLPDKSYKVFSNIPFSRTTEILRKLTNAALPPSGIWLVMEKGAAKRFCGLPGENLNSLLLKPFFEPRIVYYFNREDFHPAPRVDTVLLELKRKEKPDIQSTQRHSFYVFVSHGLRFGLFSSRALLTKKQIALALNLAGLPPLEPTGDILYIQWLCLFRCWIQFEQKPVRQV